MPIAFDRYSLLIDGRRAFIRSGAMHYFRLPSVDLWRDRLARLRMGGYNAVDLYFNWAFHSQRPGSYDFTGIRDVDRLLELACEAGLYVIARPGPYINAELSGGGLPAWLLADRNVIPRNRLPDGKFKWSQPYMDAVAEWWGQITPKIARCENLILMQIENEYATEEMEPDYLLALARMSRDLGAQVPLFHNDLYAAGLYEDVVDIYAFDNYSVTSFETDWRLNPQTFGVIDGAEEAFRPFCAHRPLFAAELQAGWFSGRGGPSTDTIRARLGRDHLALSVKSLLAQGATLFNHYLAVGGSNWDGLGSTHVETTYDFAAPIAEAGLSTERLYEAKALNVFLSRFDLSATERETPDAVAVAPASLVLAIRRSIEQNDSPAPTTAKPPARWLFLRNFSADSVCATIEQALSATLLPYECVILPMDVTLACGWTLQRASVEAIWQSPQALILRGDRPVQVILTAPRAFTPPDVAGFSVKVESDAASTRLTLTHDALAPDGEAWIQLDTLTVGLLGRDRLDRLWAEPSGRLVIGPDEGFCEGGYGILAERQAAAITVLAPNAALSRLTPPAPQPLAPLPTLGPWTVENLAPSRHSGHYVMPVSSVGADFDANGLFDALSAWYRYEAPPGESIHTIALSARHLWAAFVDGRCVGSGNFWRDPMLEEETPALKTIQVAPADHRPDAGSPETLWLWIDSLGRPKGYHDDASAAQGLLSLYVNGRDITDDVAVSPGLSPAAASVAPPEASPAARFRCEFALDRPQSLYQPLGLSLGDFPAERVNVTLNGLLIARDWSPYRRTTPFVLPEGILKATGGNTLTLDVIRPDPFLPLNPAWEALNAVRLTSLGAFTKCRV